MAENNKIEYLVNAWNTKVKDYPLTLAKILNATSEFAVDFFFKCFTINRQHLFPDAEELCVPEDKRLPMAVKFINEILDGKYRMGYMDLLLPCRSREFCFRYTLNYILHSQKIIPQTKAVETKIRSQIVLNKDEMQHCKAEMNQLYINRGIISNKMDACRRELETVTAEYKKSKQQLADFQVMERNSKESIQKLIDLISEKKEIIGKLEAKTKENVKLYSCISNWDKLLGEFNQLKKEKEHFEEIDVSISEALQEKRKCIDNFELIIETLQNLKEPLESFATNYPEIKNTYDNQVKKYDEKLKQLEMNEADTQKLIDNINIDHSITTKGKDRISELKDCLSELEKKKVAVLQRNEELRRENDCNIKLFIASMKESENLEAEMQVRYNDHVRMFEDATNRLNCRVEMIVEVLAANRRDRL